MRHHSYFRNDFQKLLAVYIGHIQFPHCALAQMSHVVINLLFTDGKIKVQISCTVTTQLISTFVIPTLIEQSLYFSNPKLQAFSLAIFSGRTARFMSDLVGNPEDRFSHDVTQIYAETTHLQNSSVYKLEINW